jgi:hypothetical protein
MEQPLNKNLLPRLWHTFNSTSVNMYPDYMKLAVIHVLHFVHDKQCFLSLSFLKNKLINVVGNHLKVVIGIYNQ